ncbi:hypothetical protein OROHE_025232 [Orobanche hederae]
MSSTQFSMVEELASLVKDNLPSKHLILSVEEVLVKFLQDGTSLDGVLELEHMNPYNRLLVHRLADIFGFSHQSVGEGEGRHLVLERCPETSICKCSARPPILVSDLLQFHDMKPPMIFEEPRWKEVMPDQRNNNAGDRSSLEERETSYFAARERIFSTDHASEAKLIKERPKHDPVVARRMITHALGQSNKVTKLEPSLRDTEENARAAKDLRIQYVDGREVSSSSELGTNGEHIPGPCSTSQPTQPKNDMTKTKDCLRKEHVGAAKRLFANALGMHKRDFSLSKCDETKKTSC